VQLRLLRHWSLQALVDAAAERFPLAQQPEDAASGGGRVYEAALPARPGAKLLVAVPAGWPRLAGAAAAGAPHLRLAGASGAGADAGALAAAVNSDAALCACDLLGFLQGAAAKLDALAPAPAAP
jgi:hypothetical protein